DTMNLLKPIERATYLLSASNYATHGNIRSVFLGIQEYLIQYKNDDKFSQCIMANAIYQKSEDYLPILDESSQISSLLDPRAKLYAFKSENEINKAKDLILKLNGYLLTSTSTIASISDDIT
ncbi:16282_t:CDS:1, partial [Funneliformis mosseae]